MINSHAAEAIRQQHRDELLSQAENHRLVRPARSGRRTSGPRVKPESRPTSTFEPARVRPLVRCLAFGAK